MRSSPKRMIAASAAMLALAAYIAAGQSGKPLLLVADSALALLALFVLRRGLAALPEPEQLLPLEVPIGVPQDFAELSARMLTLETELECVPIALLRVRHTEDGTIEPLNTSARRLLAPGRSADLAKLQRSLSELAAGSRCVIEFDTEYGSERALATASALTLKGAPVSLIALMPMEGELETEAMRAWEKLVHVLTHEIMNSLTPVASLSRTSHDLLEDSSRQLPEDIANDLRLALDAIARRAESLAQFVSGYRALASVPEGQPQPVAVKQMLGRLSALVAPAWAARGGRAVFTVEPESLELLADPGQLEQALVNLLKNAAEATAGIAVPEVLVSAKLIRGGRLRIDVSDNGPGVADDLVARIFMPYFSTKKQGDGIGLAMVRQLVHRNGGTVRYAKSIGGGARFVLTF